MKIRAFAFAAIILTAACSPDAGVGPTDRSSNGTTTTTVSNEKRTDGDSTQTSCTGAYTAGKRSCDANHWNGSSGKR